MDRIHPWLVCWLEYMDTGIPKLDPVISSLCPAAVSNLLCTWTNWRFQIRMNITFFDSEIVTINRNVLRKYAKDQFIILCLPHRPD